MSLRLTAAGVVIGLGAAGVLGGFVEHLIFGVRAVEPWIFLAVAVLFTMFAALATYGPARDAASTDPRRVLHQD